MKPITLLFILALAGCASSAPAHRFIKDDGQIASKEDLSACEYEFAKAVPSSGGYGLYAMGAVPPIVKRCMEQRGYRYRAEGLLSY